jgi:hypothetical protein
MYWQGQKQSEEVTRSEKSFDQRSRGVQIVCNDRRERMKVTRICHWFPGEGGDRT